MLYLYQIWRAVPCAQLGKQGTENNNQENLPLLNQLLAMFRKLFNSTYTVGPL
jgi:hypothetical protein